MSQYTMEIRELMNNPLTPLFNFNYPFYCESEQLKKEFEEKFINHYYYHEIGCETFARWEQMLRSRLTLKMPYYKQLYETYLSSLDINFLLNKDLLETIEHTITQSSNGVLQNNASFNQQSNATTTLSNQQEGNTTQEETSTQEGSSSQEESSTQQTSSDTTTTTEQQSKESRIENGVSQSSLETGYLTGVSQTTGSDENQSESNQTGSSSLTSTNKQSGSTSSTLTNEQSMTQTSSDEIGTEGTNTGKQESTNESNLTEKTTLLSQGNIGITSSAQLLKEWRDVLLNMDELIINDCQDLFIQIY